MMQLKTSISQALTLGIMFTSALMAWKLLMCITGSELPVLIVVSGSMEPGFTRGDVFLLYMSKDPIRAGEIVVFNVEGREIPIIHRVIKVHERQDTGESDFLTKGDNNFVDDLFLYSEGQMWLKDKLIIGRAIWFLPYAGYFKILMTEMFLTKVKALLKESLSGKTTTSELSEKPEPNLSVELNADNFNEMVVKSKDPWMVAFFAPWCAHCKKLAPEWKKAARNLQGKVKLGHVNCDDEKFLMSRYKVQGFPTILMFGADKDSQGTYEGARSASAIESFALVQLESNVALPEVNELTSADVMEEKCGPAAICFVAFLPDILDSKAEGRNKYLETLLSVAEKVKRSRYSYVWAAAVKQPELEKHVGVGGYGYPALIALNIKKGTYAPLRRAFEQDQIIEFVKAAGLGGKGTLPLEGTPKVVTTEPWDGKDGEIIEDKFFLELMGDSSPEKDEL